MFILLRYFDGKAAVCDSISYQCLQKVGSFFPLTIISYFNFGKCLQFEKNCLLKMFLFCSTLTSWDGCCCHSLYFADVNLKLDYSH